MTHSFPPRRSADLDRIGPAEPVARIRTAPERRLAESPARFRATTVAETAPTGCRNQLSHQDQCPCAAGEPWNDAPRHRIGTEQSPQRSEEHTSELQSLMRNSYAVFCLKKKK